MNGTQTPRPREMSVVSLVTTANVAANRFGAAMNATPSVEWSIVVTSSEK